MLKKLKTWWRKRGKVHALSETLESALQTLAQRFDDEGIRYAVIGGIAVSLHGPPRFTRDIDFLVDAAHVERAHHVMEKLGFETLQRTTIFANYLLSSLRVDFLHTQGAVMRNMIDQAMSFSLTAREIKAAKPEDLVGLKLQALDNAPYRQNDESDIRTLLTRFHETMDMVLLREYFVLFNKEDELEEILATLRGRSS